MERIKEILGGTLGIILWGLFIIGELYWIWMSIQLGSFVMFFLGLAGPIIIITAPIGAWSILFGIPDWIINLFL